MIRQVSIKQRLNLFSVSPKFIIYDNIYLTVYLSCLFVCLSIRCLSIYLCVFAGTTHSHKGRGC